MLWSLTYLVVRRLFELVLLASRSSGSMELEILVLRHELSILRRQTRRRQLREADPWGSFTRSPLQIPRIGGLTEFLNPTSSSGERTTAPSALTRPSARSARWM